MTTEKIYTSTLEMVKAYAEVSGENPDFVGDVLKHPAVYAGHLGGFYGRAAEILADCREKMDKKTSGAGRVNVCKRMENGCLRAELAGIHETGDRYCITDGYRAFRFSADLPSIRRAQEPFDFEKAIPESGFHGETLPPVSRAEIKEFIAVSGQTRMKPKEPFSPAEWPKWYAVNPFYLLDILDAVPDAVFFTPESYCKPLFFSDGAGNDGILLPVRSKRAVEEWNKYQEEKKSMERRSA